jgi:hypothetical protein
MGSVRHLSTVHDRVQVTRLATHVQRAVGSVRGLCLAPFKPFSHSAPPTRERKHSNGPAPGRAAPGRAARRIAANIQRKRIDERLAAGDERAQRLRRERFAARPAAKPAPPKPLTYS